MARGVIQFSITDAAGNVVPEASVEVRNSDTLSLVGLWEQRSGGDALGNPAQADEDGYFRAYCNPQRVNITATLGEFERTWQNVVPMDEYIGPAVLTPEITFITPGDLSVEYHSRYLKYQRVGDAVMFSMRMEFTATHTTADGIFRIITGLPSPNISGNAGLTVGSLNFSTAGDGNAVNWPANRTQTNAHIDNNSNISLLGLGTGVGGSSFNQSHILSGTRYNLRGFSGCYMIGSA